jgi:hypothetical protein
MIYVSIALGLVILIQSVAMLFVSNLHHRTVDKLTDKLIAKSFSEYVVATNAREDPPPEIKGKKPLSWFDDVNAPEDEDE